MVKKRILVVEDNMDTYELVKFILEKEGFETFLAMNGRDGFDAALKQKPDLVIMDLALPEMDGWTSANMIKQNPQTVNIPVIALTAHALPGDKRRAMDAGCDEYITKPIDLIELTGVVKQWIEKR